MRVLVPVDGSLDCREALKFLTSRKSFLATKPCIELLYVQIPLNTRVTEQPDFDMSAYYEDTSKGIFKSIASDISALGLPVIEKMFIGHPAELIPEYASKNHFDLIVMGARGMSTLKNLYMGSVSLAVISTATCPVLICRRTAYIGDENLHVTIAVDGSEFGPKCAEVALNSKLLFGPNPQFELVSVLSDIRAVMPSQINQETINEKLKLTDLCEEEFQEIITPTEQKFKEAGIEVKKTCLFGDPEIDLLHHAHHHSDLVIMGTHGRSALTSLVFGSCTRALLSSCDLPILIIPKA